MAMIYDGKKDKTNFESKKFLELNSAGTQLSTRGMLTIRNFGRVDYHVLLVLSGSYTVTYEGSEFDLHAGNFVIYLPGQTQRYEAKENSKSFFLHFSGTAVSEILDSSGLSGGVYHTMLNPEFFKKCAKLISLYSISGDKNAQTVLLLDILYKLSNIKSNKYDSDIHASVLNSVAYISQNYDKDITLSELAALSGYSKSRFSHLFSEAMNMSPMEYRNSLRLAAAKELLVSSEASIGEISSMTGFTDQLYFSRLFRKAYGISPSSFRINSKTI